MKDNIFRMIEDNLACAKDNYIKANTLFGRMTSEQLDSEYGQSGRKCKDILYEYEKSVKKVDDMKEWLISMLQQRDELIAALKRIADYDAPDAHAMIQQTKDAIAKAEES